MTIPGAIYKDGKVYIRYYQPVPKMIDIGGTKHVTDVRHGISMLLLEEKDVPAALAVLGGCCGGKRKILSIASEGAVRVWETGQR